MKGKLKFSNGFVGYDEESVNQILTNKLEEIEKEKLTIAAMEMDVLQTKTTSTLVLKIIKGQIEAAEAQKTLLGENWVNPQQITDDLRKQAQDQACSILEEANEYARARANEAAVIIEQITELEEQLAISKQKTSHVSLEGMAQQQYDIPIAESVSAGGTISVKTDGESVLIVEDNGLVERLLTSLLEREGFATVVAKEGRQAMQLIDELSPPAAVLLDIMLPYVSGLRLLKYIRSKREWDKTAVIMVTGNSMAKDIHFAMKNGANEYVQKPFDPIVLVGIIRHCIRQVAENKEDGILG